MLVKLNPHFPVQGREICSGLVLQCFGPFTWWNFHYLSTINLAAGSCFLCEPGEKLYWWLWKDEILPERQYNSIMLLRQNSFVKIMKVLKWLNLWESQGTLNLSNQWWSKAPGREMSGDVERHHAIFKSVTVPLQASCRALNASSSKLFYRQTLNKPSKNNPGGYFQIH